MAKLLLGALATSLSGRQDGITVRMTRHGPVLQKAHDGVPGDDAPSVAVRDRFATAIAVWSVMPLPLQATLFAQHKHAHHGSPGPWITALTKYLATGVWDYLYSTHPLKHWQITNVTGDTATWSVFVDHVYASPWHHAWHTTFNLELGVSPQGWRKEWMFPWGFFVHNPLLPLAGSSVIALPFNWDTPTQIGLGDAHAGP